MHPLSHIEQFLEFEHYLTLQKQQLYLKIAHCMATQCYNLITSLVPILYTLALNLRTYYNHDDDDDDEDADNDCCVTFLL